MSKPRIRTKDRKSRQHNAFRPTLEHLEERLTPSTSDILNTYVGSQLEINYNIVDTMPTVQGADSGGGSGSGGFSGSSALAVPAYSSRPGASVSLYLDFDGHLEANWGGYLNVATPAYDTDGIFTAFSTSELDNIHQIWQYVAEDYASFNINVTTVEPSSFANGVALRVAIGGNSSWTGGTYGGVAYVNSFTSSDVNTVYVFPANLGNGYPKYVGDASSHESGHGFGLSHQSEYSGSTLVATYYSGPGDGTAPHMGNSYSATRSMWWYGTTSSSTTFQDDMAVIGRSANGFGFRVDEHGNTIATATVLTVSGTGSVTGAGVIERMTDLDTFSFNTVDATITLTVNVVGSFANLDARLELRDMSGFVVASADPSTSFSATLTYAASAGTYYLTVASHGASSAATSTNYGQSVGQYTLSGSIIATGATAPLAPSNLAATALSGSQIDLSWLDNSDNEDGFKIERLDGNNWTQVATVSANSTTWQDTGRTVSTTYSYRVHAFNGAGNSTYSNTASATTLASAPLAPSNLSATAASSSQINITWTDNSANESGFKIERYDGTTWTQAATVGSNVTSWQDTGRTAATTYSYRARAYNSVGDSDYSNTASATTQSASAPNAPSELTGVSKDRPSPRVNLSWTDQSTNESGFRVYRSTDGVTWAQAGQADANATAYSDTTVVMNSTYTYKVLAFNSSGDSSQSNEITITVTSNGGGKPRGAATVGDEAEATALGPGARSTADVAGFAGVFASSGVWHDAPDSGYGAVPKPYSFNTMPVFVSTSFVGRSEAAEQCDLGAAPSHADEKSVALGEQIRTSLWDGLPRLPLR